MAPDEQAAHASIVDGIRRRLEDIAARTGAQLVDTSSEPDGTGTPTVLRLVPPVPGALPVRVMPDDCWSTFLGLGDGAGWVETFTSPKRPEAAATDVVEIVEAAAAGRVRTHVLRRRRDGAIVARRVQWQRRPGGPWRTLGAVMPPARRRRYDEEIVEHAPYASR